MLFSLDLLIMLLNELQMKKEI